MEDENGKTKKALKGVHVKTDLHQEDFINTLYNNTLVLRKQCRLRRDPKKYRIRLQEEKKKALNALYFKMKVSENFVSCTPHTDANSEYL